MSRSITVQPKEGFLPWRAHPGPETTMAELEAAISMLKLDILRTTDDEILLVQTAEAIKDDVPAPDIEELSMVMFGLNAGEAILVEETGTFDVVNLDTADAIDQEAKDRHFEEDADREMIGDDVDLGIENVGNK